MRPAGAGPRIAFTGNIGNCHYAVVRALRSEGLDAHMFVGADDPLAWRPETDDPELGAGYPEWIHEGRWYGARDALKPWRAPLVAALREFDVIIASGSTPAFVQFVGRPWCFFATGGDITVRPFPWTFRHRRGHLSSQIGQGVVSAWQRRALRRADQLWIQPFAPFVDAVELLSIDPERVSDAYFPLIVDTEMFAPRPPAETSDRPWVEAATTDTDFVVFSPTRLVFGDSAELRRSGQWKGSQTLLDGFAQFVERGVVDRPALVLPDWVLSDDVTLAKSRVREMGLERHVRFLEPPRPDGFNRNELVDLYSVADVAVDQFSSGWFGLVSLEAMSCATPVVSRLDLPVIEQLYGNDWEWLPADDATDAADWFSRLASDRNIADERGRRARAWIERHHSPQAAQGRYVEAILSRVDSLVSSR